MFNNRTPAELDALKKNPPVIRIPLIVNTQDSLAAQRERADVIANNLKLISLEQLVQHWQLLLGNLEQETDPTYDKDLLLPFVQGKMQFPGNITQWCMRVQIDKMKLFLNRISLNEVKNAIHRNFDTFVLTSSEDTQNIVIRIYLGQ